MDARLIRHERQDVYNALLEAGKITIKKSKVLNSLRELGWSEQEVLQVEEDLYGVTGRPRLLAE